MFSQQCDVERNAHPDQTVDEVYEAMQRKTLMLRAVGYTVIEKWGCEYKEDKKTNAELKAFLNNYEAIPPLQPRDGFFGGRTGATRLYAKAEPDKEILYQDFTCGHNTQERAFCGTWCTPELQKAVEKGYQILKIHEVLHFTSENQRVGLFKEYGWSRGGYF